MDEITHNNKRHLVNKYAVVCFVSILQVFVLTGRGPGQWVKLPAWKIGDRGFEPHSRLQVSKKKNVSLPRSLVKNKYCGEPP